MDIQKTPSNWRKLISPYEKPSLRKSVWQLASTLGLFFLTWYAAYASLQISYGLTLVFAIIAAGLLVRIFIIFHDCCHGSFFKNRIANEVIGTITGVLTCCPFYQWQYTHSMHHATNGNLDQRGIGDIWTMTVQEYSEASAWKKFGYRLYRNPIFLFGLAPAVVFLIDYRFNRKGARMKERLNTYLINVAIVAVVALLCWLIGWKAFLAVHVPIFLISGLAGFWLFYVQHQFEHTYFERADKWDHVQASLQGSSFYRLPKIINWFTGSIGYHHIHHLSSRVPNYYLDRAHTENRLFQEVEPITFLTSLRSLKFRLWDEQLKKMKGFGE